MAGEFQLGLVRDLLLYALVTKAQSSKLKRSSHECDCMTCQPDCGITTPPQGPVCLGLAYGSFETEALQPQNCEDHLNLSNRY